MCNHATKGFSFAKYGVISILHRCNLHGKLIIAGKTIIGMKRFTARKLFHLNFCLEFAKEQYVIMRRTIFFANYFSCDKGLEKFGAIALKSKE